MRAAVALLCASGFVMAAACSRGQQTDAPASRAGTPTPNAPSQAEPSPSPDAAGLAKATVTIYFPSASGDTLAAETREIVDTKGASDRGAQIIAALIDGPQSDAALPAVPAGTTLRHLWVREDGCAYADFSEELAGSGAGGSDEEILSIYAIVDSLTANVPSIQRVAILIAGHERESLGHLDLTRPLVPDTSLIAQAKTGE